VPLKTKSNWVEEVDLVETRVVSSSSHAVYRTAKGQLLYLNTKTRPDVAVAVGVLARLVSAPAEVHWTEIKRILRYMKGTSMYGLHIAPQMTN
jgi:hypothetical protein